MTRLAPSIVLIAAGALITAAPCAAQAPAAPPASSPGMPQMSAAACAAVDDGSLPPALAAWTRRTPVAAAADPAGLATATLTLGQAADARLRRTADVAFPVAPSRPGAPGSFGGLFALQIRQAGEYQVSLGAGAWVEMTGEGRSISSVRHAPGPACTSLKKTVVFPLELGSYVLELTGNAAAALPVLVTRAD